MRADFVLPRPNGVAGAGLVAVSASGRPMGTGVRLHKSGLLFTAKQSLGMWEKLGVNLFSVADSSAWWIADWLVYGETTFQDRYVEAVKRTSLSYQTLRNYTWVARRFPLPRRRQNLSFSHHLEVVALEQPQQDYWLRKAEELGWSRNKLRGQVRSSRIAQGDDAPAAVEGREVAGVDTVVPAQPTGTPDHAVPLPSPEARLLRLQFSAEDLEKFEQAASRESEPVEAWAAEMLRRAAGF
ncbi:LmbU family transcriptional regulator [Lentzea sp. NPDC054927]